MRVGPVRKELGDVKHDPLADAAQLALERRAHDAERRILRQRLSLCTRDPVGMVKDSVASGRGGERRRW